ncbi:S8 family serine peptidase [Nonomuraea sp. SMC257]|uniref:S8 family serine peptidase n=1 Tax=Nonomuraea montanisoli TaxID=2741721 RepID=A0A7Y6IDT4_9ACTN|nr:S8 family serine peptidase [Nonomuraea montanisoli]NUW34989.1 S8 family serine peptidase [Nonomuraea montanisoli]
MRLRPLVTWVTTFALLTATPVIPAHADDPAPSSETSAQPTPPEEKLEDGLALDRGPVRAIVELTDPAQREPIAAKAAEESVDVVLRSRTQPFMVVEGTAEELAALAEDPRVSSVHRDRAYPPAEVSNLQLIGADQAHAQGFKGSGQAVAVLDTGIDLDHPSFGGRVVEEACFSAVEDGVTSLCPNGQTSMIGPGAANAVTDRCLAGGVNLCEHGTHVAGIAAGAEGVAPEAKIVAIQVFSRVDDENVCGEPSCLLAYESSLRLAMEHVAELSTPVAAVNLSLGGMLFDTSCDTSEEGQVFKPLVDALLARNIATVVAAGNEYYDGVSFPACVSSAVAVGANDGNDAIADFSNRGELVDLFAPGVDIESSVPDNQKAVHSGTSMASPHVAGALALLKAKSPDTPMTELIAKLTSTGRPYAYRANDKDVVTPRLDVLAALGGASPQPTVSQTPAPAPTGGDPAPDPAPDPTDGSGPTPEPDPVDDTPDPTPTPTSTPVPLPTVTVTVTITPTPTAASTPPPVCTRGKTAKRLTAKQWAMEIHRSSGTIPDATLTCYLKLAQKGSKVFPELTKASSLGSAYRVLKASKTARQRLDAALLAGWLTWAHGTNGTARLASAEKVRLSAKAKAASLKKAASALGT